MRIRLRYTLLLIFIGFVFGATLSAKSRCGTDALPAPKSLTMIGENTQ